ESDPPAELELGRRHPVAQLDHPLAQMLLSLQRCVDLLALAMPPLHRQVELRGLQSRHLEVGAESLAAQRLEPLLQPPPWAGEDRNLVGKDRALSGRRLLLQLLA